MKKKNTFFSLIKIFAVSAVIIHMINKAISISASFLNKLDRPKEKRNYTWKFGNIFYTKKGQGKPLLLIHDLLPGASGYEWSRIENILAKDRTVYTIDLPGCGRSEKPALTYTNFFYVQMLCDFITNVIKEKTEIMVSGYSSSFVLMAAQYNNEVIASISMINPSNFDILTQVPSMKDQLLRKIMETPVFGTLIYHIATSKANIENDFIEKYYYNPFHVDHDVLEAYYEAAHKNGSNGKYMYASLAGKYINLNMIPALARIEIPVSIFMGSSETSQEKTAEEYTSILKDSSVCCIERSKHFPHIENPNEFMKAYTLLTKL